jgi:hypothetical protein
MRRILVWLPLTCLLSSVAAGQPVAPPFSPDEEPGVVPSARDVEYASYHVPAFSNELVTVLNVFIPPHRESGYHRHSLDSVGVLISDTARTGQVLGAQATVTVPRGRGSVNFTGYARAPLVHTVAVTGDVPFHNIVVQLLDADPGGFTVGTRGQGYTQLLDNERVRVWRLVLEPGETAPVIKQAAPGVRVVIDGGELVESDPDRYERSMAPRSGEFFWQEAGQTRAVRNVGSARIELVEIELK